MLINFFFTSKKPRCRFRCESCWILLDAMDHNLAFASIDDFYTAGAHVMVKDEKYYDRFDKAFGAYFKNLENIDGIIEALIPEDWLRKSLKSTLPKKKKPRSKASVA